MNGTLDITATEFSTAHEAVQHSYAEGGVAMNTDAGYLVTSQEEADQMRAAGVEFAYLAEHKGQIVTVPIN